MGVFDTVTSPSHSVEIQVRFPFSRQRSFSVGNIVPELSTENERFFAGLGRSTKSSAESVRYFLVLIRGGRIFDVVVISKDEFDRIEMTQGGDPKPAVRD